VDIEMLEKIDRLQFQFTVFNRFPQIIYGRNMGAGKWLLGMGAVRVAPMGGTHSVIPMD
jgi:hypothetical protein